MPAEYDMRYLEVVLHWLYYQNSTGYNFQKPYIRLALRHIYPLYIIVYSLIFLFGVVGNLGTLIVIARRGLCRSPMYVYMGNMALIGLFNCGVVMPITVANLLIENWMFGSLLCVALPMMHFLPIHVTMLTHLVLAVHRYRHIVHPIKSQLPAGLCIIGVWVVSICTVLPYPLYVKYIDLEQVLGPPFQGQGICWLNLDRDVQDYNRATFVTTFCLPLGVIACLFIKVSAEIKYSLSDGTALRIDYSRSTTPEGMTYSRVTYLSRENNPPSKQQQQQDTTTSSSVSVSMSVYKPQVADDRKYTEDGLDIAEETRVQNHLIAMVTLFAACWFPIQILIIVTHFVYETTENTYITLAFVGYLSTCINPVVFASLRLKREVKARMCHLLPFASSRSTILSSKSAMISKSEKSELSPYTEKKMTITEIDDP